MKKITIAEWIAVFLFILSSIIALYTKEIRDMVDDLIAHWPFFLFWTGIIGLFWTITHIILRIRVDSKFDEKLNTIIEYNKSLRTIVESDGIRHNLSLRIFRDAWLIPSMIESEESQKEYAKLFYDMGFKKEELEKYFSHRDTPKVKNVINMFMIIYLEEERKKREAEINKNKK